MFSPYDIPPKYLFIETTTECNLRCKQCHMWMSKENPESLTTDEKMKLINQFHKLNPNGVVVLTGGETMLKTEEFFSLTKLCRQLNLTSAANTNATLINESNYERTLNEGPKYLVISLDSHVESIHDYIRGVKGSYRHTIKVLRELAELKRNKFPDLDTRVVTNSILFDNNISLWSDYIKFAKTELNIDGVMFQILSRTFWNRANGDPFFEKHFFQDKQEAKNVIDKIIGEFENDEFVLTKRNDLEWMKLYVENPDFIGEQVCGSHERNIMIDQYGDVQLCFSMRRLMNGNPLGNVRQTTLSELWTSNLADEARGIMSNCRQNCGMLNCHRKQIA